MTLIAGAIILIQRYVLNSFIMYQVLTSEHYSPVTVGDLNHIVHLSARRIIIFTQIQHTSLT